MRGRLIHDGDVWPRNGSIGWDDDAEIRFARELIAEAQAQVVPHDADGNLTFSNVGNAGACWRKVPLLFKLHKEVDAGLNVVHASTLCQCCRIDSNESIIGLAWVTIYAYHVFVIVIK